MISSQLPKGFSNWYQLDDEGRKNAPSRSGTYIIRLKGGHVFGRLKGKSDIVYMGSTVNLRRRFYQFLHPASQLTNQRINNLAKRYDFEIAWLENDEPRILEHNLLRQYLGEHDELPPLNYADVRKLEKVLQETIRISGTVDAKKL